ncbi:MAG: hypothetical protein Q4D98_12380 [Planctomycetia bacterium]|nr:hypothetical protein [Planctomycetia bacterium]
MEIVTGVTFTQTHTTTGSVTLVKQGEGTLFFNGTSSFYAGAYDIQEGTLKFQTDTSYAFNSKTVTGAGTLSLVGGYTSYTNMQSWNLSGFTGEVELTKVRLWNPTLASGTTITVNSGAQYVVEKNSTSATGLIFNIAGDGVAEGSDYYGAIRVVGTLENGTINLTDDALITNAAADSGEEKIKGSTINLERTLADNSVESHTLTLQRITISDSSTINVGEGTLKLTSSNVTDSTINVARGILELSSSTITNSDVNMDGGTLNLTGSTVETLDPTSASLSVNVTGTNTLAATASETGITDVTYNNVYDATNQQWTFASGAILNLDVDAPDNNTKNTP